MTILFQNDRFLIRNLVPEDFDAYMDLYNDERVTRYLPKRSVEENTSIFQTTLEEYAENKALGKWGIFNTADNEYIGTCILRLFNDEPDKVEVGYSIIYKYWGKGIATEMARALVAYAFERTATPQVVAVTTLENIGSQRVLEKAGLKRMENIIKDGRELAYFRLEGS